MHLILAASSTCTFLPGNNTFLSLVSYLVRLPFGTLYPQLVYLAISCNYWRCSVLLIGILLKLCLTPALFPFAWANCILYSRLIHCFLFATSWALNLDTSATRLHMWIRLNGMRRLPLQWGWGLLAQTYIFWWERCSIGDMQLIDVDANVRP